MVKQNNCNIERIFVLEQTFNRENLFIVLY